jgi:thiopurine S-methyltransferase
MTTPRHEPGAPPIDTGADAWEAIYQDDDAGWDLGEVSPPLKALVAEDGLPPGPGLVLGCGTGHEVAWLYGQGIDAHGVDFAPSAVVAAQARLPTDEAERIIAADVLALAGGQSESQAGRWAWLFDRTFFCALQPTQRADYARAVHGLLQPGGIMFALQMRTQFSDRQPFDSTPGLYISGLEAQGMSLLQARKLDAESHSRRRGRETLVVMGKA